MLAIDSIFKYYTSQFSKVQRTVSTVKPLRRNFSSSFL